MPGVSSGYDMWRVTPNMLELGSFIKHHMD